MPRVSETIAVTQQRYQALGLRPFMQEGENDMRELHDHKISRASQAARVVALDEPGPGGAHAHYALEWDNPSRSDGSTGRINLLFQRGAVEDVGINGITNEALLAIVIDRLEAFQRGPCACGANEVALAGLRTALGALKGRTTERIARGVEGRLLD